MKSFKFFTNNPPTVRTFHLNVLGDLYGRLPNYTLFIEPYELEHTQERTGSIRNIITGIVTVPTHIYNGVLIKRRGDGSHVEINYHNVGELNQRGLIFDMNDSVTFRYRV
jgi:hypothetical protein